MNKNRFIKSASILSVLFFLFITLFMASAAAAKDTSNQKNDPDITWQTIPITLQMEAGNMAWNPWTSGTTMIAGTGWITPFGRGSYHYGSGFAEASTSQGAKPDFMDSTWSALFATNNLCIYHLGDGDIYAYDGIMANVEPAAEGLTGKMDYILEVIVGGTGRYRDANGIMLGRTPGRGAAEVPTYDGASGPFPLPKSIVKVMKGYINIAVKDSRHKQSLPAIGTQNPQKWPDAVDDFLLGSLVPINIEMEAGGTVWNPWTSGTTMIAGMGWVEPFGRAEYHYGSGFNEDTDELKPDFMEKESWLTPYPTKNLCIYHLAEGDLYAYDGIVGNLVPASDDGKVDYILEIVVGGTGEYEGAAGIILGYTFGRGDAAVPSYEDEETGEVSYGPFPLPQSIIKIMEGYVLKK